MFKRVHVLEGIDLMGALAASVCRRPAVAKIYHDPLEAYLAEMQAELLTYKDIPTHDASQAASDTKAA